MEDNATQTGTQTHTVQAEQQTIATLDYFILHTV